jgi:hypothetical protein
MAAALVFHLPGARLELVSPSGRHCSIGPMTDPRCVLHPAEFRELVLAAGDSDLLGTMMGFAPGDEPTMTLTSSGVDMNDLGGGLYRVVGCEFTSYAFTTMLPAREVDALLAALDSAAGCCDDATGGDDSSLTVCVNLVQDDGLGVTLVSMSSLGAVKTDCVEAVAAAAAAKCLVAEMEQLATSGSSPG